MRAMLRVELQGAEEREVVRFGAAGGEDDFGRTAAEKCRDLFAGMLEGGAGTLAWLVDGAGVCEVLGPKGSHGGDDLGQQRRRGVRVHVEGVHGSSLEVAGGPCIWIDRGSGRLVIA